jgi:hypothetical protein
MNTKQYKTTEAAILLLSTNSAFTNGEQRTVVSNQKRYGMNLCMRLFYIFGHTPPFANGDQSSVVSDRTRTTTVDQYGLCNSQYSMENVLLK